MHSYKHTLTAEQLRQSAAQSTSYPATEGVTLANYYSDHSAEEKSPGIFSGLELFKKDTYRQGVKINGIKIQYATSSLAEVISDQVDNLIMVELGLTPNEINTAYSQNLMSLLTDTLNFNLELGMNRNRVFSPVNKSANLYRDAQDDQIYFKMTLDGYEVQTSSVLGNEEKSNKPILVKGPIEVLYKLEHGIFKLQHIQTDSDFLRDVFVGKNGLENQLKAIIKESVILEQIENLLLAPPPAANQEIKEAFFQGLTTIGQYQQGQKTANESVESLKAIKPTIQKSERNHPEARRASMLGGKQGPSTEIFDQVIAKAKELPGYVRKRYSMIGKVGLLGSYAVGSVASAASAAASIAFTGSSEKKESTPAANDPKIENDENKPVKMHIKGK